MVTRDAASLIAGHVLPMLEEQLVRLGTMSKRGALKPQDMHSLVELTRATVALRYVDIRVAEGERKAGKGAENLEGLTVEELLAKAQQLLKAQGLDTSDLRKLSAWRSGEAKQ